MLWLNFLGFVFGFILLVKGGDWLVDGASALAKRFNISDLVIGLTVVSFGTSAPELLVNIYASFAEVENIALGNIFGSNVANVFLVLGAAALYKPLTLKGRTIWKEIPFALIITLVLAILLNDLYFVDSGDNILSNGDGLILLTFFGFFMYYTYNSSLDKELIGELPALSLRKSTLFVIFGIIGLAIGGKMVVESAESAALSLGISDAFIGLTAVALGTSLPELITSLNAASKSNSDIAVGNIVGSNIFNIALVLGVSSTIKDIPYHLDFNIDLLMATLAVVILFGFMFSGKRGRIDRWEGAFFLLIYIGYIIMLYFTRM
ncbi:MAG: calcium/sodium antiporter [Candidatus Marinimicrobia bacterium]|nr:calcium/sodium antiporter [Candidatus Neomarinimicrobiota bacterium]MCF7880284.1 calcium/sodium antiporter [Candidatus Neomarinimicrobiota bacterium]